ncbi:MAG: lipoprotein insertase outer membrane protein LolB [Pseudomonadota bacterium]
MRVVLPLVLLLSITACAAPDKFTPSDSRDAHWQAHVQAVSNMQKWRAMGRIAVKTKDDGGTVRLIWDQNQDDYTVRLSAPLGKGVVRLRSTENGAELSNSDGSIITGKSAEELVRQVFGWQMPIDQLGHWLTGLPGQHAEYSLNTQSLLGSLNWKQWEAQFERYTDDRYPPLPSKIRVASNDVEIRVVIDSWNQSPSEVSTTRIPIPGE